MNFADAYCKKLPKHTKELFVSLDIAELKNATVYCNLCGQREACLSEGMKNKGNSGVWGGKILSMGKPIRENSSMKRISYWRR
jgi:hypothetical protein